MPSLAFPHKLSLRRLTVDEALYRLDVYLDAAFLHRRSPVRIIHGKGTGRVRNAVWERLAEHPLVRSYELALYGQGDAGVTIVTLEER